MSANRPLLIALGVVGVIAAAFAFVPIAVPWPAYLLPAVVVAAGAFAGAGAGILSAIVASVALGWAGERAPGLMPLPVSAAVSAMWAGVILVGWHRRRIATVLRTTAHDRADERTQARTMQKEIDFYTQRGRDLAVRAVVRRRLLTAAQELGALLDPAKIQERLVALALALFPETEVVIWPGPGASAVATRAFESGQALVSADGPDARSEMAAPVRSGRTVVGALHVSADAARRVFGGEDLRLLEVLASLATDAIGNGTLFDQVQQNALRDGLTGLLTHRAFEERLEAAVLEATRYRHPLSVVLLDVDHFKAVNDTHGHPAGDVVLQGIAHVLDRHVRDVDVLARYGGEEFVILLYQTSHVEALAAAEGIREDISEQIFDGAGRTLRVTASFGVATLPDDGAAGPALLRAADQSLYAAKRAGRNRVVGHRP